MRLSQRIARIESNHQFPYADWTKEQLVSAIRQRMAEIKASMTDERYSAFLREWMELVALVMRKHGLEKRDDT